MKISRTFSVCKCTSYNYDVQDVHVNEAKFTHQKCKRLLYTVCLLESVLVRHFSSLRTLLLCTLDFNI